MPLAKSGRSTDFIRLYDLIKPDSVSNAAIKKFVPRNSNAAIQIRRRPEKNYHVS